MAACRVRLWTAGEPVESTARHERGARQLVEPGRPLASARQVYGEVLEVVFGRLAGRV